MKKPVKKPSIAELQRAHDEALAAERRAVEAVPETPPRHARAALTAALDEHDRGAKR